jgi:flagellar biosynthesis/type III secretory pathway protein FliH
MAARFQLETFETPEQRCEAISLSASELEEARLIAFEQGYSAGWEDSVAAQDRETVKLRTDLGNSLQALSFSYHEARTHVLHALEPLLRDMVLKVLPAIARESLAGIVLEQLVPLAKNLSETPISIVVHPNSRESVEDLLAARSTFPMHYVEEPTLSEGQAFLRLGDAETRIDLDGVIAAIAAAVATFFQIDGEEKPNE